MIIQKDIYGPACNRYSMSVVSMEELVSALKKTLGKKGMQDSDIQRLAEYTLSFFGYTDLVIDNRLTSEDRDVFYMLEEEGFVTTTEEEVHLKKGKMWRIHYWILKKDQISRLAALEDEKKPEEDEMASIYENIDKDVWARDPPSQSH
jgi:hypothetical protein